MREALNAGLSGLPEYPPALSPEQLGGTFYKRQVEEQQKNYIMSGYNNSQQLAPQQTGYPIQMQQTGFYQQQQPQQAQFQQQQQTGYYGVGGYMGQGQYYG